MRQYQVRTAFVFFLVISLFVPLDILTQNAPAYAEDIISNEEKIIDEIKSWYFYNITNSTITIFGNLSLEQGLIGKSLDLDGKDSYIVVENKERGIGLSDFTLSAWVKPDYTHSPAGMTVLNSESSFDLAITNHGKKHVVQFSIFDGLKWISVESKTEITDDWTNIIAAYNRTAISIYINGEIDSSANVFETLHYYAYGKEVVKIDDSKIKNPVLRSDVFIGGTQSKDGVTKLFSGQIDEVQFYITPSSLFEGIPKIKAQNNYILNATSCAYDTSIQCSIQLSFYTSEIKDNKAQITFDHGVVSINGIDYLIKSKDWRGTIPTKSGQATFSGPAVNSNNDEIRVAVVGNFLDNTMNGHLYRTSGSIKSQNIQTDLFGNFELISSTNLYEEKITPIIEKPAPPKILLMTKPFQSAFVKDYFKFDLKVYYFDKNPFKDYYQKGFEVQNATVSLQIISPTGSVLKRFDGVTNNQGYFSGEFIVPPNTAPGLYSIVSSAASGESSDSNSFSLLISEPPIPPTSTEEINLHVPTITLNGTNPQIINKNSSYVELGATASDPEDGDISGAIVIDSSAVNTAVIGNYIVTYTVTDSSSNTVSTSRTVNVIDTLSPTILLSENLGMTDTTDTSVTSSVTQSITESLGTTDTVSTTSSATQSLTENIGMTDSTATTRSATVSSTENIGMTDSTATTRSATQYLTESLGTTDTVSTTQVFGTQFARPDADISVGTWDDPSPANNNNLLWDDVDEIVRSDTDYVTSANLRGPTTTSTMQINLSDVNDPNRSDNHFINYTFRKSAAGGNTIDLSVTLLQGTTTIATWSHLNMAETFTLANQTLTTTQANSITNYNDLRLEFTGTCSVCGTGSAGRMAQVSWAEMELRQ